MFTSATARACAWLSFLLLAGCGGGEGVSAPDRAGSVNSPPPAAPSTGAVEHPSCEGYPQSGLLVNGMTICEQRDFFGLAPGDGVSISTRLADLVIVGGPRSAVDLKAFIYVHALTEDQARETASQIVIHTDNGEYYATGPDNGPISLPPLTPSWWVSFDAAVPSNVHLLAANSTGDIVLDLEGTGWSGPGVDLVGSVSDITIVAPSNYNARFELHASTGSVESDFGGTPDEDSYTDEHLVEVVGSGGTTFTATTSTGDIELRRK